MSKAILCDICECKLNSKEGYIIFKELKQKKDKKYSYTHNQLGVSCKECYIRFRSFKVLQYKKGKEVKQ